MQEILMECTHPIVRSNFVDDLYLGQQVSQLQRAVEDGNCAYLDCILQCQREVMWRMWEGGFNCFQPFLQYYVNFYARQDMDRELSQKILGDMLFPYEISMQYCDLSFLSVSPSFVGRLMLSAAFGNQVAQYLVQQLPESLAFGDIPNAKQMFCKLFPIKQGLQTPWEKLLCGLQPSKEDILTELKAESHKLKIAMYNYSLWLQSDDDCTNELEVACQAQFPPALVSRALDSSKDRKQLIHSLERLSGDIQHPALYFQLGCLTQNGSWFVKMNSDCACPIDLWRAIELKEESRKITESANFQGIYFEAPDSHLMLPFPMEFAQKLMELCTQAMQS